MRLKGFLQRNWQGMAWVNGHFIGGKFLTVSLSLKKGKEAN